MKRIHSPSGSFLRRSIGFRTEIVEESEDHDTFAVTGGSFTRPEPCLLRDHDDPSCRDAGRSPLPADGLEPPYAPKVSRSQRSQA